LLALFIESALLAIDNHIIATVSSMTDGQDLPSILFLNHVTQFSLPTKKTITGQLLERTQLNFVSLHQTTSEEWMISVNQEQIVKCDPDCLIFATSNSEILKSQFKLCTVFQSLKATKNHRVFFVDSHPHAPTQYVVLAYYDIANAVMNGTSPYLR
jgi:ABC-type Fe3+-citrate transport system substrate-binding protein